MGSQAAIIVLNDERAQANTDIGAAGDATSLENMKAALEQLKTYYDILQKEWGFKPSWRW